MEDDRELREKAPTVTRSPGRQEQPGWWWLIDPAGVGPDPYRVAPWAAPADRPHPVRALASHGRLRPQGEVGPDLAVRELVAAHRGTVAADAPPVGATMVTIRLARAVPIRRQHKRR